MLVFQERMDLVKPKDWWVDIGGGRQSLLIGKAAWANINGSLHMWAFSFNHVFFDDGTINKSNFQKAVTLLRVRGKYSDD